MDNKQRPTCGKVMKGLDGLSEWNAALSEVAKLAGPYQDCMAKSQDVEAETESSYGVVAPSLEQRIECGTALGASRSTTSHTSNTATNTWCVPPARVQHRSEVQRNNHMKRVSGRCHEFR